MPEKKVLVVIPPRGFQDDVLNVCRRMWTDRGYRVTVASLERGLAQGEHGEGVWVDLPLRDVKYYDYDAIAFIGGEGAPLIIEDEQARKLAKDAKYKVLAASGNAVILLALAEAAEKKRVTGPVESVRWVEQGRAVYTGRPFEVDDKTITLREPELAPELAQAVVKALEK